MPSTSAHFPPALLEELDQLAAEKGVSRNRVIVDACRESLRKHRDWPTGFFDNARFSPKELSELRANAKDFETYLISARRNRKTPPL